MLQLSFQSYPFKITQQAGQAYIWDFIRKKNVRLNPEEWVRQHLLHYFVEQLQYPKGFISVEKQIQYGTIKKRYDIVVYDAHRKPWMLVECKRPEVTIDDNTLGQLLQYHAVLNCPHWLVSNGQSHFCAKLSEGKVLWLNSMPEY